MFITFFRNAEGELATYYKEPNYFYHPMGTNYSYDTDLELRVQLDSKLYPECSLKSSPRLSRNSARASG